MCQKRFRWTTFPAPELFASVLVALEFVHLEKGCHTVVQRDSGALEPGPDPAPEGPVPEPPGYAGAASREGVGWGY